MDDRAGTESDDGLHATIEDDDQLMFVLNIPMSSDIIWPTNYTSSQLPEIVMRNSDVDILRIFTN